MNKYETLENKLRTIKECLSDVEIIGGATKIHVVHYERYLDDLIKRVHNREICNSNGALLGLIQGISNYDELCSCDRLWESVQEADHYYSRVCITFE